MDFTVEDNAAQSRFEARADDSRVAGYVEYVREDGAVVLVHTEVAAGFQGLGVGSRLVRGTMDLLRGRGDAVVNRCPFIGRFMARHPGEFDWVG